MGNLIIFQTHLNWSWFERVRVYCTGAAFFALALVFLCAIVWPGQADAQCATLTTLTNGTVADATQVNQIFSEINNSCAPTTSPSFMGQVSIGTTSPTTGKDLTLDNPNNYAGISFRVNGTYIGQIEQESSGNMYYDAVGNIFLRPTGNVGIGMASPLWKLFIQGNTASTSSSDAVNAGIVSNDLSSALALIFGQTGSATIADQDEWLQTQQGVPGSASNSGNLSLQPFGGNVGIGTTSPDYLLQVNGDAFANSWQMPSDARLKKNITPISGALDTIQGLQGVRFEWRNVDERLIGKSLNLPTDKPQIGLIAQDVRTVLPEAVSVANDGLMSLQEDKIVPVLVEAVKQLKAANDSEAKEIEALKSEIAGIERERGIHTANN